MTGDRGDKNLLPTYSHDLITSLKGRKIVKFFKVLEWEKEKIFETFNIENSRLFELSHAKFYMELNDGRVICFFTNIRRTSICISLIEKKKIQNLTQEKVIQCNDKKYSKKKWANLIGQKIVSCNIIKYIDDDGERMGMDERGIQFILENGEFIFCNYLAYKSISSSIITKISEIPQEYTNNLNIIKV